MSRHDTPLDPIPIHKFHDGSMYSCLEHRSIAEVRLQEGKKRCTSCGDVKPLDDFYKTPKTYPLDGRITFCKVCHVKKNREYRRKNRIVAASRRNQEE